MTPFDFIKAINTSKENLFTDPQANKDYSSWMVNRGLSQFHDTVLYANEMNFHYTIPKEWQFSFLLNSIPKKNRFSKWAKKEASTDDMKLVMEYYGYSREKARQILGILPDEQLSMIKEKLYKGGK